MTIHLDKDTTGAPAPQAAEAESDDSVRRMVGARAQACLDHVRTVQWGKGESHFEIADGDIVIEAFIYVRSARRKDKTS